jgi:hypothetical protein
MKSKYILFVIFEIIFGVVKRYEISVFYIVPARSSPWVMAKLLKMRWRVESEGEGADGNEIGNVVCWRQGGKGATPVLQPTPLYSTHTPTLLHSTPIVLRCTPNFFGVLE